MNYKLINTKTGEVVACVIAGDWRRAAYKLSGPVSNTMRTVTIADGDSDTGFVITCPGGQQLPAEVKIQHLSSNSSSSSSRHVIRKDGPITTKQAAFLRRHGHDVPVGATKRWASSVISEIIEGGR